VRKISFRCVIDAGAWPEEATPAVLRLAPSGEVTAPPKSPFALNTVDPAVLHFLLDLAKDVATPIIAAVMATLLARIKTTPAKQIRFECGHDQVVLPATATPEQIAEASKLFAEICADTAARDGRTH
jgi:hypothetical protein